MPVITTPVVSCKSLSDYFFHVVKVIVMLCLYPNNDTDTYEKMVI